MKRYVSHSIRLTYFNFADEVAKPRAIGLREPWLEAPVHHPATKPEWQETTERPASESIETLAVCLLVTAQELHARFCRTHPGWSLVS